MASEGVEKFSRLQKRNGGERNQTFAAVIANHPFTNALSELSPR